MARPLKARLIKSKPKIHKFSPRGKRGRPDYISLKLEEFETLRLSDFDGLGQSKGALAMGISRQTFGRILKKGRTKLADALINGKIIKILKS